MQLYSAKAHLRFALPMLCVTVPLLAGCGAQPSATPPVSVAPPAIAAPAPETPSFIDQADQAFKGHSWDDAISLYSKALAAGLPNGPMSSHGSDAYVRRNISRAHEYKAVEASQTHAYTFAETEFHAALKADSTNLEARRLLVRTQRAGARSERETKRDQDALDAREADYQASQNAPLTTIPQVSAPDPYKDLVNDVNRQNGQ